MTNDYTDSDVEHLTLALVQQEQVLNECESLLKETISEDGVYADFDARLAAYWEKSKALADWRTRDMLIAESHQHKIGLAAQIDRARRQIQAWPPDVRAAMGLPNTSEPLPVGIVARDDSYEQTLKVEVASDTLEEVQECVAELVDHILAIPGTGRDVMVSVHDATPNKSQGASRDEPLPQRTGDWQSCYGCRYDVPIKGGKHVQENGATYFCYNIPTQGASRDASSGETNYILGCANCGREYFADGAPACNCRSARTGPADLVGALQDVVHTDPGPVRAGKAVKGEPCEVDQLRAALRWLMLDNCFTDTSAAFDSDMPKPAGVGETLERERLALYPPSQRT